MKHSDYLEHIDQHFTSSLNDKTFYNSVQNHIKEFVVIVNLNLDPVIGLLEKLYSPVKRVLSKDPVCMLRSLLLMTLCKESSITNWVKTTRSSPFWAILTGFHPDETPGIGTYYDFMKRIIDAGFSKSCKHVVMPSTFISSKHKRNLKKEKSQKQDDQNPAQPQSEKLCKQLLADKDTPRTNDFHKLLEDLLVLTGITPSIDQGVLTDLNNLVVSGDGSILITAASSYGKPTCACRSQGIYNCEHDRYYTSPTAQWYYDPHRDCYLFGDRYYHLVTTQNGHDLPLLTIMPGGNESDYTLSLKALDRFLKASEENNLNININAFCGDGHHDSYAHYDYLGKKEILPIIPLSKNSSKAFPSIQNQDIIIDIDGSPLCPARIPMRHHMYNKKKNTHVFACPVKRSTHRNGKQLYVTHIDECPRKQDCAPQSSLGPIVYIKSQEDPRLYPPLPRNSLKFKNIMKQRSASERYNYVNDSYNLDRACRNADYGLIRLTFINIVEHAVVRHIASLEKSSLPQLFHQTIEKFSTEFKAKLPFVT